MEAELKALLTMTVTITPAPAATAYGGTVPGVSATWPTRIRWRRQEVATQAGEAAVSDGHLWLDSDVPVPSTLDLLTLPGGQRAPIIAVDRVNDEAGHHHTVVYFGTPANG